MTDTTTPVIPPASVEKTAAPVEVKADSLEDLVNRVARIEAQLNINPDVE